MGVSVDRPMHRMILICDGKLPNPGCTMSMGVLGFTREDCNERLLHAGWRLHKKKTLCPACAARVTKRLGRKG